MPPALARIYLFGLLVGLLTGLPALSSQDLDCRTLYGSHSQHLASTWSADKRNLAFRIMLDGSSRVSRTVKDGRRFLAPAAIKDAQITAIAEENFEKAARYVVENFENLPINKDTAIRLNIMLTNRLVPEQSMGNYRFRPRSGYSNQTDNFVSGDPDRFYAWIESPQAHEMQKNDPVAFAEKLHHNLAAMDSFPDGNGRLSRLFADLALLREGLAPAYYTDMADYFARGNARSENTRLEKINYFREIAKRGMEAMRSPHLVQ